MREIDELKVLQRAADIVTAKLMVDREFMEIETVHEYKQILHDLKLMAINRRAAQYAQQLIDFQNHMDDTYTQCADDGEDRFDTFYSMKFEITFNGKTIVIDNSADVFNNIHSLLQDEINEYK